MTIYGIGIDIVNVTRIAKSVKNKSFILRLFDQTEVLKCSGLKNKNNCYAKRFAAKEAFAKAFGTGVSNGISFNEIIVQNNKRGKPYIKLLGRTKRIVEKKLKKKFTINLTLSDDKPFAIATVIISL